MNDTRLCFQFAPTATKEKPDTETTRLLEKAQRKGMMGTLDTLTREEKNRIAEITAHSTHGYRLSGWCWPLWPFFNQYLVNQYGSWQEHTAPDKTSLRHALTGKILQIVFVPKIKRRGV